jgi:8-oxo-dGTP diphosphatase
MKLVAAVLLENENGEFLLGKKPEDELYTCPGGKHEEGESIVRTAIRELREETGIVASEMHFLGFVEPEGKLIMFFWCSKWKGKVKNMEPEKCLGWEWFPLNQFPKYKNRSLELFEAKLLSALKNRHEQS